MSNRIYLEIKGKKYSILSDDFGYYKVPNKMVPEDMQQDRDYPFEYFEIMEGELARHEIEL